MGALKFNAGVKFCDGLASHHVEGSGVEQKRAGLMGHFARMKTNLYLFT